MTSPVSGGWGQPCAGHPYAGQPYAGQVAQAPPPAAGQPPYGTRPVPPGAPQQQPPYGGPPTHPSAPGPGPLGVAGAPAGWGPPYPYFVPVARQTTNGMAIAAMVLGIVWIYWIGSILAVVFGHIALRQIKRDPYSTGRGMAIAGLVLGYVGVAVLVALIAAIAFWDGPEAPAAGTDATYALSAAFARG